jgi:protein gp37
MSNKSKIQWTDATWQTSTGCSHSGMRGCDNCFAIRDAWRMSANPNPKIHMRYAGTVERHVNDCLRWTGRINLLPDQLEKPLHWKRPRRVFVNSLSDLFHQDVPDEYIAAVFGVMAATPQHTYQLLTKRYQRLPKWFKWVESDGDVNRCVCDMFGVEKLNQYMLRNEPMELDDRVGEWDHLITDPPEWPLENVWPGASASTQKEAEQVHKHLSKTPAAIRWYSLEPLVGPIPDLPLDGISWVVVGGEGGPNRRECKNEWIENIIEQCVAAGVPVFVKQCHHEGEVVKMPWLPASGGRVWDQMPEVAQ